MIRRPPAIFVGDAPGLDFLNSIATPAEAAIDWIADGEGYLGWLEQAHLAPAAVLREMKARAAPREIDRVAEKARGLREWFRDFVNAHKGRPLTPEALAELEPLNRLLEHDEGFSRVAPRTAGSGPFELRRLRRWPDPNALLLPVAEALAQLVCTEDFSNVKRCEGASCTLLVVDHTRRRARRWCSMSVCGNRAKQATHRSRLKTREG